MKVLFHSLNKVIENVLRCGYFPRIFSLHDWGEFGYDLAVLVTVE